MIDDIIDPRETRPTVIRGLRMARDKRVERPWKKHGVSPVMSVAERASDGWNAFLGRIRDPQASRVTAAEASTFEHLRGHKHA
jgi:hypothetical protein